MLARLTALALATVALAALRAQFDTLPVQAGVETVAQKLWLMADFFTILTDALVTLHLLAIAKGWQMPASRAAGLLVSVLLVALVYHMLLARLWAPQGLAWWADQGLHSALPLGYLAWWIVFAPKDISLKTLPNWLVWPLSYCAYALFRGDITGFWPYPFLNADRLGWPRVALNVTWLGLGFVATSLAVLGFARWRQSAKPS